MVVSHKAKRKQHARASSGLHDHYSELFIIIIVIIIIIITSTSDLQPSTPTANQLPGQLLLLFLLLLLLLYNTHTFTKQNIAR